MKFTTDRPYSDPDKAARRLMDHARAFEPVQDGCIYIEKINAPFLYVDRGTPDEFAAGLDRAIELGWLEIHDSGTFVRLNAKRCRPVRIGSSLNVQPSGLLEFHMPTFVMLARSRASAIFYPGDEFSVKYEPTDREPFHLRFGTMYRDAGFDAPLPVDLWVEGRGSASDVHDAGEPSATPLWR